MIFVQGCPWQCGYCHNPHLQPRSAHHLLAWDAVLNFLTQRQGLLDAVVFSGGEPTIDPALGAAMAQVRALGFGIGLHTAGAYPRRLAEVLPLVDWVALDYKSVRAEQDRITTIPGSQQQVLECARLILDSGLPHEFRSTLHPLLHTTSQIQHMAQELQQLGVRHYALQQCRATGCASATLRDSAAPVFIPPNIVQQLNNMFETFVIREA